MSLFQKIRSLFGVVSDTELTPIEQLRDLNLEYYSYEEQIKKAQGDFNDLDTTLSLKISACDKLIEDGVKQAEFNKKVLSEKLEKATDEYLNSVGALIMKRDEANERRAELESDILQKAVLATAMLSDDKQREINNRLIVWNETGVIEGEEVATQVEAIQKALDTVLEITSEEPELEKAQALVPIDAVKTVKQKITDITDVTGHYANAIVRRDDKILLLKRASDKVIAPGQWCLPGGHIDGGETIQQATARELKEEANLDCHADCMSLAGKAKCGDGKWAFYCFSYPSGEIALLDGESVNGGWFTEKEWMEMDLIFDLKDHLKAIIGTVPTSVESIPEIKKAEDLDEIMKGLTDEELEDMLEEEIEKAEKSKDKKKKTLSVEHLKAHSENTSSGTLRKASRTHPEAHVKESAKRELERRAAEKAKNKDQEKDEKMIAQTEKRINELVRKRESVRSKLEDHEHPHAESLEREFMQYSKEIRKLQESIEE